MYMKQTIQTNKKQNPISLYTCIHSRERDDHLLLLLLCGIEDNRTARKETVEDVYVYETNNTNKHTKPDQILYTCIHTVISHHPPEICRYNNKKYREETELNTKQQHLPMMLSIYIYIYIYIYYDD